MRPVFLDYLSVSYHYGKMRPEVVAWINLIAKKLSSTEIESKNALPVIKRGYDWYLSDIRFYELT